MPNQTIMDYRELIEQGSIIKEVKDNHKCGYILFTQKLIGKKLKIELVEQ